MSHAVILIEEAHGVVKKSALAGITFAQEVTRHTQGGFSLLVVGRDGAKAAEQVRGFGAARVLVATHDCFRDYLAESYTHAVLVAAEKVDASLVASAASARTKDLLPRVAARWDAAMASEVMSVVNANTFNRPMWAGNVVATVELTTAHKVCSVRPTEFGPPVSGATSPVEALDVSVDLASLKTRFVSLREIKSERPDATVAARVVSGGRGVKGPEGFKLVEALADLLGAGVGASRAICDAGWVPNDLQIGQTGKVVAPDLYIAIGISGAIQHVAGMKGSKTIVAINKDPEAPIFQVADYGLVADLFQAVPELIKKLSA